MVGVLREAGVGVRDQPVLPGALGLPDGARTRLLVDHDGLFRVYCADNLPSSLPIAGVKGKLKAAREEALIVLDRNDERFVALHTTAEGEDAQVILVRATEPDAAKVTFDVKAIDDDPPEPRVTCTPASGSNFPIGETTVSCSATDHAGNEARGSFKVMVRKDI
jgi:hypothetical protein